MNFLELICKSISIKLIIDYKVRQIRNSYVSINYFYIKKYFMLEMSERGYSNRYFTLF
jgi:hypothetical protein